MTEKKKEDIDEFGFDEEDDVESDFDFDLNEDSEEVQDDVGELEAQQGDLDLDSQISEAFDQMMDLNSTLAESIKFVQNMPDMFDQNDDLFDSEVYSYAAYL